MTSADFLLLSLTLQKVDWEKTLASLQVDRTIEEPEWAKPGTKGGVAMLESFIDERLKLFATQRNDPNTAALSQLSPWIRFGRLHHDALIHSFNYHIFLQD